MATLPSSPLARTRLPRLLRAALNAPSARCLVCGGAVGEGEAALRLHGDVFHERCATYRPRRHPAPAVPARVRAAHR